MYNFKFNFLSRGQLESLSLDRIFLPLFKILPCCEGFFSNLIFAIIARILCGNYLNKIPCTGKQKANSVSAVDLMKTAHVFVLHNPCW